MPETLPVRPPPVPSLVIDTNVVLAWLLFEDPRCAGLGDAVVGGRLAWVGSAPMRDELAHVLGRGIGAGRRRSRADVLDDWDRLARLVEPWDRPSERALRCSDGDDQKFVDLALQVGAAVLVSRDRAVLKLARRAARHGLAIVPAFDGRLPPG